MENKQPIHQIDPDVLQCKADILRARNSGIIEPENLDPVSSEKQNDSSTCKLLPYALRPLGQKVGRPVSNKAVNPPALRALGADIKWPKKESQVSGKLDVPITTKPLLDVKIEQPTEQKTVKSESQVPKFNLAEQILSAQRTAVASRRQKSQETAFNSNSSAKGIKSVVEKITDKQVPIPIMEIPHKQQSPSIPADQKRVFSASYCMHKKDYELIGQIVARDIREFCGNKDQKVNLQSAD